MKLLSVVGARPQLIKSSMISRAIRMHNQSPSKKTLQQIILQTGQHYDTNMSQIFIDELNIPEPDYNLGISGVGHGAMTGRMLEGIEIVLHIEKPDWVIVYGDTNSTLAGALAASKLHIRVAHIEAGLRSQNMEMPEEINRIITDRISTILICPSEIAVKNLQKEGFPFSSPSKCHQKILNLGDVMLDATLYYRKIAYERLSLDLWNVDEGGYVLCTLHREENTNNPKRLKGILSALRNIALQIKVLLPIHPRTRKKIMDLAGKDWLTGINVINPVSYLEMQRLQMSAKMILTDSGGIQKEAYFHRVPCLTLRDETEWGETVSQGWNEIVGADPEYIFNAWKNNDSNNKREINEVYGKGNAANSIVEFLNNYD